MRQDIDWRNILINQFSHTDILGTDDVARAALRTTPNKDSQLRYALYDFDLSALFPLDVSIDSAECRLPASTAGIGAPWNQPADADVDNGVLDYDPFKFDVACIGNMLHFNVNSFCPYLFIYLILI